MSLSDHLDRKPERNTGGTKCTVGALRAGLPADEQAALDTMIWGLGWSDPEIHRTIVAEGHDVAKSAVGKHRRRDCACGKASA